MIGGLTDETVAHIQDVLRRFPEVQQAILYGSRAKGNYKEGSDIDLALLGDTLTLSLLSAIDDALDDLLLPYTFDLSIFSNIDNPGLKEHIHRVGIVFYIGSSVGVQKTTA
jgi:uncharacterized protein